MPNFQNPRQGLLQPAPTGEALAERLVRHDLLMVEDDPYGELRFEGETSSPIAKLAPNNTVLLGSFSKTVVPRVPSGLDAGAGLAAQEGHHRQAGHRPAQQRLQPAGAAPLPDRHSLDAHLEDQEVCWPPAGRHGGRPEPSLPARRQLHPVPRGMFLWLTLPPSVSAMAPCSTKAIKEKVVFVPGAPFYVRPGRSRTPAPELPAG